MLYAGISVLSSGEPLKEANITLNNHQYNTTRHQQHIKRTP